MEKYYDLLIEMPLFSGIDSSKLTAVLTYLNAYISSYKKDEFIKLAGDSTDFIGIVLEGNVQILQDDFYGNRSITASLEPGDMFAEAFSCAEVKALHVDILSASNTTVLFLNSLCLFHDSGCECGFQNTLITNLNRILAKKNMYLTQKLGYLSHKTTQEKLLAFLNDRAKQNHSPEFTIPFDRQGLADYLGVERSAMSAEISKLVKQGVIETKRSWFRLLP